MKQKEAIAAGKTALGIEFGSTRIKAVLIDEKGAVPSAVKKMPSHRSAPTDAQQTTATEILETGIKVIDLICP